MITREALFKHKNKLCAHFMKRMEYVVEDPTPDEPHYQRTHWIILVLISLLSCLFGIVCCALFYKFAMPVFAQHHSPARKVIDARSVRPTPTPTPTAGASATLTPSPTPKPPSKWGTAAAEYLRQTFGKDADKALELAKRVSHLNCQFSDPKNGTYGLFAISDVHKADFNGGDMLDCYNNIDEAKKLVDGEGWAAWGK